MFVKSTKRLLLSITALGLCCLCAVSANASITMPAISTLSIAEDTQPAATAMSSSNNSMPAGSRENEREVRQALAPTGAASSVPSSPTFSVGASGFCVLSGAPVCLPEDGLLGPFLDALVLAVPDPPILSLLHVPRIDCLSKV